MTMTEPDPQPYKEHDTGVRWASPVETNDGTGWVESVFDPRPEYEQDRAKYDVLLRRMQAPH